MKRQKVNIQSFNKSITQEEIQYNTWYHNNLIRLGIEDIFDGENIQKSYDPFHSEREYIMAQDEATLCLIQNKPIPKELEEKLIKAKTNREKQLL